MGEQTIQLEMYSNGESPFTDATYVNSLYSKHSTLVPLGSLYFCNCRMMIKKTTTPWLLAKMTFNL